MNKTLVFARVAELADALGSLPRVDLAYKVAQALDVSIEFLLTGKEPLAKQKVHHLHVLEDMKKATLTMVRISCKTLNLIKNF